MGDGFPVRTLFSHQSHGASISPFLLLDYAGPAEFPPSDKPRGVEEHPHKGFETVTIVYSGEVDGERQIMVDPERNEITVDGRLVQDKKLDRGHTHRIYFQPSLGLDRM